MPFLSFFADEQDAEILLNWLNAEDEIAFIVQDQTHTSQQRKWKAVHTIDQFTAQKYSLWHVPTGSLSVLNTGGKQPISDPWGGWIEHRPGADRPNFSSGELAEIRLELWLRHHPYTIAERATLRTQVSYYMGDMDLLPVSDFQWISDHYRAAPLQTWQWWRRLTVWMSQNAIRVGRFEDRDEDTGELEEWSFWAFPSAFAKLRGGMAYYARGYKLENAFRNAESSSD